jgi:hypothetical protein
MRIKDILITKKVMWYKEVLSIHSAPDYVTFDPQILATDASELRTSSSHPGMRFVAGCQ